MASRVGGTVNFGGLGGVLFVCNCSFVDLISFGGAAIKDNCSSSFGERETESSDWSFASRYLFGLAHLIEQDWRHKLIAYGIVL